MAEALKLGLLKLWGIQRVRFLIVGATNTAFGYVVFVALLTVFGPSRYVFVGVISHLVATTVSFGLNRSFVFGNKGRIVVDFFRFQLTYTVILALNISVLVALVEGLAWPVLPAQAVCLVFVAAGSYFGHKHFSFRRQVTHELSK